ncbi:hypothetical protein [Nocardia sp. NBC_00511]|uniref:hypothetical protein n=1 Tax=Nocardia sp. NBC_00511 TaxID=2903591 RepID=UPI0030E249E7
MPDPAATDCAEPRYAIGGVITGNPIELIGRDHGCGLTYTAEQVQALGRDQFAALKAHLSNGGDDARP